MYLQITIPISIFDENAVMLKEDVYGLQPWFSLNNNNNNFDVLEYENSLPFTFIIIVHNGTENNKRNYKLVDYAIKSVLYK